MTLTVCLAAIMDMQDADRIRMLVEETDAPVADAQTHMAFGPCQHLQVAVAGVSEAFDRSFYQFAVAPLQRIEVFRRSWAEENALHY